MSCPKSSSGEIKGTMHPNMWPRWEVILSRLRCRGGSQMKGSYSSNTMGTVPKYKFFLTFPAEHFSSSSVVKCLPLFAYSEPCACPLAASSYSETHDSPVCHLTTTTCLFLRPMQMSGEPLNHKIANNINSQPQQLHQSIMSVDRCHSPRAVPSWHHDRGQSHTGRVLGARLSNLFCQI